MIELYFNFLSIFGIKYLIKLSFKLTTDHEKLIYN